MRLHAHPLSGHSHKVRLLLGFLGIPYEEVRVDIEGGAHKRAPFLAMNPSGTVPVLEAGDVVIPDSQAILVYLAASHVDTTWLPKTPIGRAEVARWLSFAANEMHHGPNMARLRVKFGAPLDREAVETAAHSALTLLEERLKNRDWLVGESISIADLACAPYGALAPEGGIALDRYGHVTEWLDRIRTRDGFTPMPGWGD